MICASSSLFQNITSVCEIITTWAWQALVKLRLIEFSDGLIGHRIILIIIIYSGGPSTMWIFLVN